MIRFSIYPLSQKKVDYMYIFRGRSIYGDLYPLHRKVSVEKRS